jgi:hypothetical protein
MLQKIIAGFLSVIAFFCSLCGVSFDGDRAVVSFTLPGDAKSAAAYVYYRTGPLEYEGSELKEDWKVKKGTVLGSSANVRIPEDAELFYILIEGRTGGLFKRQFVYASSGIFTRAALGGTAA